MIVADLAKTNQVDVSPEEARVLHRVVRSIHDGNCPNCGIVLPAERMKRGFGWECPECRWGLTNFEAAEAMKAFHPVMQQNVATFETWRAKLREAHGMRPFDLQAEQIRQPVYHAKHAEPGKSMVPAKRDGEETTTDRRNRLDSMLKAKLVEMAMEAHAMLDELGVSTDLAGTICDRDNCWHRITHRIHLLGEQRDALAAQLQKLIDAVHGCSARTYLGPDLLKAAQESLDVVVGAKGAADGHR